MGSGPGGQAQAALGGEAREGSAEPANCGSGQCYQGWEKSTREGRRPAPKGRERAAPLMWEGNVWVKLSEGRGHCEPRGGDRGCSAAVTEPPGRRGPRSQPPQPRRDFCPTAKADVLRPQANVQSNLAEWTMSKKSQFLKHANNMTFAALSRGCAGAQARPEGARPGIASPHSAPSPPTGPGYLDGSRSERWRRGRGSISDSALTPHVCACARRGGDPPHQQLGAQPSRLRPHGLPAMPPSGAAAGTEPAQQTRSRVLRRPPACQAATGREAAASFF